MSYTPSSNIYIVLAYLVNSNSGQILVRVSGQIVLEHFFKFYLHLPLL